MINLFRRFREKIKGKKIKNNEKAHIIISDKTNDNNIVHEKKDDEKDRKKSIINVKKDDEDPKEIVMVNSVRDDKKYIKKDDTDDDDVLKIGGEFLHNFKMHKRFQTNHDREVIIVINKKGPYEKYILKIKENINMNEREIYDILVYETHPNVQQVIMMYESNGKYCFLYEYTQGY
ncbi:MAG: hypothetical protein MUO21_01935, partial [Nitrososphaeraceae archaeon]|nr:hypothetical protein [Nitrososphaeraceae archaeon]